MKFITKRREVSSVAAQSASTARARCSIRSLALRDAHFHSAAKVDVIARSLSFSHLLSNCLIARGIVINTAGGICAELIEEFLFALADCFVAR